MLMVSSILCSGALWAADSLFLAEESSPGPRKSGQEISKELDSIQIDFYLAKEMFIPWYTGPLITGSASNPPFRHINIEPYLFLTVNHAVYNGHRHSENIDNIYVVNPLFLFQAG